MNDIDAGYWALRDAVGAVWLRREVVEVRGADAESFLQGQVSQDVPSIAVGAAAWSFILQPHGKVDAFVRISRLSGDHFLLDVDRGYGDAVRARLEKFTLRSAVVIAPLDWTVLALRGPSLADPAVAAAVDAARATGAFAAPFTWPGFGGVDLIGPKGSTEVPDGVHLCSEASYEALRIEAGVPVMGAELDERTIPAEAGVNDLAVHFRKGCYTGQELVARINSRGGNVPRHLRAVVVIGDEEPVLGARIASGKAQPAGAKPFGYLSSIAYSPGQKAYVGLAMVRRDVHPPMAAEIEGEAGALPCRIESLPLA